MSLGIEDKIEIQELVARYGTYADEHNWEKLNEVFTSDAVFEFKGLGLKMNSLDEIQGVLSSMGTRAPQAHLLTNILSEATDEGAKVQFRGIFPALNPEAKDGSCVMHHGSYFDDLVKTEAGWRVQTRLVVMGPRAG